MPFILLGLELFVGLNAFEKFIDYFRFTFVRAGKVMSSLVGDLLVMTFEVDIPF